MEQKELIKNTGATFTPKGLADFLASKILKYVDTKEISVLDPSCGDGELLLAIGNVLQSREAEFTLNGYDLNQEYLNVAKQRLAGLGIEKVRILKDDFLNAIQVGGSQITIDFRGQIHQSINETMDVVIANPPYVRTQILGTEQAQLLSQKFGLKGRVDLYYPFLIAMTESLRIGGIIGVITSNRYLSTKSGESVRKFLGENYEVIEVLDLGDTKLFDAAVLPAIFLGRKKSPSSAVSIVPKFTKIYEQQTICNKQLTEFDTIYDVLNHEKSGSFSVGSKVYNKTEGILICQTKKSFGWDLLSNGETDWVKTIDSNAVGVVEDFFKVRVGVKSTADKVFISDNWDSLGDDKPENELLKDLISPENIGRWKETDRATLQVLYPHLSKSESKVGFNIDNYPKAKKYLESHESQLKNRKYLIDAGRQWYELWVPQNPVLWRFPKLVFPDISAFPRFFFDEAGKLVNGNCYWIVAQSESDVEKLLLIQGISNSNLMTKYHDLVFNNKLYSGRRRYISQYVGRYPLPDINSEISKSIVRLVQMLNSERDDFQISLLEVELEKRVAEAFGVAPVFTLD